MAVEETTERRPGARRSRRPKEDREAKTVAESATPPAEAPAAEAPAAEAPPADVETADTIPVATSVVRLEPGLYAVEIVTDANSPETDAGHSAAIWLSQVPSGPGRSIDVLSPGGTGDQWLNGTDRIVAVRAPSGGALLTATMFGSSDRPP